MNGEAAPTAPVLRHADLGDPATRARIGAWVAAHPEGTPFHLPEWSTAVSEGCGQRSRYLVAERPGGAIAGVLPLTEIRSPLFGHTLVSTGFGVGGGVLAEDRAGIAVLAEGGWALAQRLGCTSLELRGGPNPGPEWHCDERTYCGFARDLAADDAAELLAIPRKQRAEVRRALGNGLTVETGSGPRAQRAHYAVYAESVRNLGTPVFPRRLFSETIRAFGDAADLLIVRHGGIAVAGVLSLYWRGTVYPYWGGGTAAARALRANDAMYFALMGHARARGCTRFDFGRSKAGTGAAAFKKNWGFTPEPLRYFVRTADGAAPPVRNPLDPRFARKVAAWQRLPLWLANAAGPWIARGLG